MHQQTTVIRDADWIVGFNSQTGRHQFLRGQDVAFSGDRIVHVGGRYDGPSTTEIDGSGRMVSPGLVNIHSHPLSEPLNKGFLDELASAGLYQSSLYEFMALFGPDDEGRLACTEVALSEALLSGVTTLVDLSVPYEGWLDLLSRSGLRAVAAPMYRSAHWFTRNGHVTEYEWNEAAGEAAMRAALDVIDRADADPSGRLSGMIAPAQIDTCTAELIRDSHAEARRRGLKMQIHAAQSVVEFQEITRRHGRTPIEWLEDLGVLDSHTIIGHAIFLNDHPWVHWPQGRDLERLAASGAAVAHCPTVFQRRGMSLRSFGRYLRAGATLGIGTDTYPHNMLEELRHALINSRLMSGNVFDLRTSDVFDAATVGGGRILGRSDIGRIEVGAKADLFLADVTHPAMRPVRDPLRSLIYVAAERAVTDVFVDGRQVVRAGEVLAFDLSSALGRLEAAQRRAEIAFTDRDFKKRSHLTASPLSYELADG
ncbi:amidohydrolase family protein [Aquamicrobium sp. LC103]|uniref:amidohydrolase family protein n=1 Tax=Aquamicrobium sp. LC103 TaxID=1120658 RepID=UPI00063E9A0C|nr:amidohydrolase family protein [Aquamicrobium sp. LC103]